MILKKIHQSFLIKNLALELRRTNPNLSLDCDLMREQLLALLIKIS